MGISEHVPKNDVYLISLDGRPWIVVETDYEIFHPEAIIKWYAEKYDFPVDELTCTRVSRVEAPKAEVVEHERSAV